MMVFHQGDSTSTISYFENWFCLVEMMHHKKKALTSSKKLFKNHKVKKIYILTQTPTTLKKEKSQLGIL